MKKTMLWAGVVAALLNLVNVFGYVGIGLFDDWSFWRELYYYSVSTAFIWFWLAILVWLGTKIKEANKAVKE